MSVYGYIRVSTGRQADEGHSLPAQSKKILAYAALKELGTPVIFCDAAVSAAKTPWHERPQGDALLSHLVPGDHVIVTALSRAFRSNKDAHTTMDDWRRRGLTLHVVDLNVDLSTPMGRFFFAVMAATAELERDQISERTRAGLEQARSTGVTTHRAPFGFTHDARGHLDPKMPDLIVVAGLLAMRRANWPVVQRLAECARRGWRTPTGFEFDRKLLKDTMETVMRNAVLIEESVNALGFRLAIDHEALVIRRPDSSLYPGASDTVL